MSYNILSTDFGQKTINVSFNSAFSPVVLFIPYEFWNLDTGQLRSADPNTQRYISGFSPSASYINAEVSRLRNLSKTRTPIKLYIPLYLQSNERLMQEINVQVGLNRIKLVDDSTVSSAEYVLLNDWAQDYNLHQIIFSPNGDNYIYLRNRFIFLSHISNLVNFISPYKASLGEVNISTIEYVAPKFLAPKSLQELENFLDGAKMYHVTRTSQQVVPNQLLSSQDVLNYFSPEIISQNQSTRNLYSMKAENEMYIVEEAPTGAMRTLEFSISRPLDPSISNVQNAGVLISIDDDKGEQKEIVSSLIWILQYTFYYYATHAIVTYKVDGNFLSIIQIDPSINLSNPNIEQIYCN